MGASMSERWYAVACCPQRELLAAELLRRRGRQAFVPTEVRRRRPSRTGARRPTTHCLVPGYVLLCAADADDARAALYGQPYLRSVLGAGDQPVSERELDRLRLVTGRDVVRLDRYASPLKVGDEVQVLAGHPWSGWRGVLRELGRLEAGVELLIFNARRIVRVPLVNLAEA